MTKILDLKSVGLASTLRSLAFPLGPSISCSSALGNLLSKLRITMLVWLISQVLVRIRERKDVKVVYKW